MSIQLLSRYDLYLVAIPVALLAAVLGAQVLAVSVRASVFVGSLVGAGILADGLFVRPPDVGSSE